MNQSSPYTIFKASALAVAIVASSASQAAAQYSRHWSNWEGIVQLVKAGDEIAIDPSTLKLASNAMTVKWRQNLSMRKADYVHTVATFSNVNGKDVMSVFVQRDKIDAYLAKCGVGSDTYCTMRIDRDFQYGESASRSFRFLVFHDKKLKPDMRRFIDRSSSGRFWKSGRKFVKGLDREELAQAVAFTSARYRQKNSKILFGKNGGLRNFNGSAKKVKWSLRGLSKDRQIVRLDTKARRCYSNTAKIFGKSRTMSDGSVSRYFGQDFRRRCHFWERRAWTSLASRPARKVTPADLGRAEAANRKCITKAERDHGHRSRAQKRLRAKAAYRCETTRKRTLLSLGANPTMGYNYGSRSKADAFFNAGSWRLK